MAWQAAVALLLISALLAGCSSQSAYSVRAKQLRQPHSVDSATHTRQHRHEAHGKAHNNWALSIGTHLKAREADNKHSQGKQDQVLEYIFHHIGATNKFFVEFGFNVASYEEVEGGNGANTATLFYIYGWRGLLMDGGHENSTINLHKEFITPYNIVELFDKYNVPHDADYVSIDVDSTDVWIFRELLRSGRYRPRVVTVEYNANYPLESTITFPDKGTWPGTKVMGSAFGAIKAVADELGYSVVWTEPYTDMFFVRDDLLEGVTEVPPMQHWRSATSLSLHPRAKEHQLEELWEYHAWVRTNDETKARAAAQQQLKEMDIDLTSSDGW